VVSGHAQIFYKIEGVLVKGFHAGLKKNFFTFPPFLKGIMRVAIIPLDSPLPTRLLLANAPMGMSIDFTVARVVVWSVKE
jgi:hypothetical protein